MIMKMATNQLAKWTSLSNAQPSNKQGRTTRRSGQHAQPFCSRQCEKVVEDQVTAQAIYDAHQTESLLLRQEAAEWLWVCCPDIAEDLELSELDSRK